MNIFDSLPSGFFNLLASNANNRIYSECFCHIYNYFEHIVDYRIEKDALFDCIETYLSVHNLVLKDADVDGGNPDFRAMARKIVSRMSADDVGWIQIEVDDVTFKDVAILTPMGIKLADFLLHLHDVDDEGYGSFAFDISNTLDNDDSWTERPYKEGLIPIHNKAMELKRRLSTMYTHLGTYIGALLQKQGLDKLVDHYVEFLSGDFIEDYRSIKNNEAIRNRDDILTRIGVRCETEEAFNSIVDSYCKEIYDDLEKVTPEQIDEAQAAVTKMISDVKRILDYEGIYDQIMDRIQQKLLQYNDIMASRLRFLHAYGDDVQQLLEQVILQLNEDPEFTETDGDAPLPENISRLFSLYSNNYVDKDSVYRTRMRHIITQPASVQMDEVSEEDLRNQAKNVIKSGYDPYNEKRIVGLVQDLLKDNGGSFAIEDLDIRSKSDLMTTMAIAVFATREYDINISDEYAAKGGYIMPKAVVSEKKEARSE